MQAVQTVDKAVQVLTATIAINGTTSDAVNLYGCTGAAFQMPAAITGTSVTFLGSIDKGVTFKQIRDINSNAITFTVAADGLYPLDKNTFAGIDQIKFVMVSQTGGAISILVKPFSI